MYDAETNWLCDEVTPMCSKDPAWLDDDPERKLLLPRPNTRLIATGRRSTTRRFP